MWRMDEIIKRASDACGGTAKLAALMGESVQTVSNWRDRGIPVAKCAQMEVVTGGAVTRIEMRPNDWHRIWPELAAVA